MGERCVKRVAGQGWVDIGIKVKIDYGAVPDDPVLHVLGRLVDVDKEFNFTRLRSHWFRHGYITPRQMVLVAWRLKINRIAHTPSEFRVSTELPSHRAAVSTMEKWKRDQLRPYLTVKQRQELGV
jgi:hypothetical protein